MFLNADSIRLNNISMGQYLLSAKYEYNKLWGSDTGRNLKGKFSRDFSWHICKDNINF